MTKNKFRTHVNAFITRAYTHMYSMFHRVDKKVTFLCFSGKQYADNPRAISEKLHDMFPEYRIEWFLRDAQNNRSIPPYVSIINQNKEGKFALYRSIATSFCFVTNNQMTPFYAKRKKQFFIQTWHGDTGMKKILYDAFKNGDKPFPIIDGRITDLAIAGSDLSCSKYRSAFHYTGEVIKCGTPRNDKLIVNNRSEQLNTRNTLGILPNTKVLLFAPTFRDGKGGKQHVQIDLNKLIKILEDKGDNWVCVLRAHAVSSGLDFQCDGEKFIDATRYPDMSDLLAISDMLITDYSSCSGDLIRAYKPVILAMFDKDDYTTNYRELYYDPEAVGFIVAYSQEELEKIISTYTAEMYTESCNNLIEYFGIFEPGNAAETICKRIDDYYKNNYCRNCCDK